jgi:hypothetical protein
VRKTRREMMSRNVYSTKYHIKDGILTADFEAISVKQACNDLQEMQAKYRRAVEAEEKAKAVLKWLESKITIETKNP